MTCNEIIALVSTVGGKDVGVFTLKAGTARVCVTGGDIDAIEALLRDHKPVGIAYVLEHRAVRGWRCTERFLAP